MSNKQFAFLLKYGIPSLALVVVAIQFFYVNTYRLSKWKVGAYGMYTEIHYSDNQIYIPGLSLDSLLKDNMDMKNMLGYLLVMTNKHNLKKAAELVLETPHRDSIHIQIWKPIVNSKNGSFSRKLIDEIYLKNKDL
jgi:hypothetical protein